MFIVALFTIAKLWNQPRCHQSINDKENVAYIHKEILFGHNKE
jgi:hypothetical protein